MERRHAHFQGSEAFMERLLRAMRVRRLLPFIPTGSVVVDVGCGYDAFFLQSIANHIRHGIGIDLSVQPHVGKNIQTISHDVNTALPFDDHICDVVVSMANLEHLEQPQFFLHEACRILKPGGRIIMTTPTTFAKPVLEFLAYRLHVVSEQEIRDHKIYFTRRSLYTALNAAGFTKFTHRYFQLGMNNFVTAQKPAV